MNDARTEFIAVDRDIAWVTTRISDLERLLSDPREGASSGVVRQLLGEWRERLRALQARRETLARSLRDADEAAEPAETPASRGSRDTL